MFSLPQPTQQIAFAAALRAAREEFLQQALGATVAVIPLATLDAELGAHASSPAVSALASRGLRGELLFCVPCVLRANPRLLAYYRLLLGYSQKSFYSTATGLAVFRQMEDSGRLSDKAAARLTTLCSALNAAAATLLEGLGSAQVTAALLDDLALLTLGPQLRGGANVRKGDRAIKEVFQLIASLVADGTRNSSATHIELRNAAGRVVRIEFAADPDIVVRETMGAGGRHRLVLAVEIKGGEDFSNVHNRIGEAEKSHQKAKQRGFQECWTILNVPRTNLNLARRESPSTDRFYVLSDLLNRSGESWRDFRDRIVMLTGLPAHPARARRRRD